MQKHSLVSFILLLFVLFINTSKAAQDLYNIQYIFDETPTSDVPQQSAMKLNVTLGIYFKGQERCNISAVNIIPVSTYTFEQLGQPFLQEWEKRNMKPGFDFQEIGERMFAFKKTAQLLQKINDALNGQPANSWKFEGGCATLCVYSEWNNKKKPVWRTRYPFSDKAIFGLIQVLTDMINEIRMATGENIPK